LSRVLKARDVVVDADNKVHIKVEAYRPPFEESDDDIPPELTAEEIARELLGKAEYEAAGVRERAEVDAQAIKIKAEQDAAAYKARVEAQADAEAQMLREQSQEEGYSQGMAEANAVGEQIRAEAQQVLDDAIQERDEMRLALEPDAVGLIIDIVAKLLGDTVVINPAVIISLIRQGFAGSTLSGKISVRVSESDYEHAEAGRDELMAAIGGTAELEIVKDLSLGAMDCVIETPFGGIDVSLTPQFEALRENLIYLLEHPT